MLIWAEKDSRIESLKASADFFVVFSLCFKDWLSCRKNTLQWYERLHDTAYDKSRRAYVEESCWERKKAWNALIVKNFEMKSMILRYKSELETDVINSLFMVIFSLYWLSVERNERMHKSTQTCFANIFLSFTLMILLCIVMFIYLSH